ncbi:dihydropteroate synthase [Uliginosibacterium sp. H1]|uniref:dihydropteroate synthase n=1 Tax=Uliginosibacterium sp. H1 TaxID=3114757 RepID=UPI002E18D6A3|nr:dihydropteroate synthase [Uliginosibacterium sp. H1]
MKQTTDLQCAGFTLSFEQPKVMAIINLTPDSFSGDGHAGSTDAVLRHAEQALADGADMLDIGGESSRPGAQPVSEHEELDRVLPALERLLPLGLPISVDTVKPVVMREAARAGAAMINDINALQADGALEAAAQSSAAVCLMHMQGEPRSMQQAPHYDDVVHEVEQHLLARARALMDAGCAPGRIVLDPGFGFGKTLAHNVLLFRALPRFAGLGYPLLVGVSRKTMLGHITGRAVQERQAASAAAALMAAQHGAAILRVHDVAPTVDALKVWAALRG